MAKHSARKQKLNVKPHVLTLLIVVSVLLVCWIGFSFVSQAVERFWIAPEIEKKRSVTQQQTQNTHRDATKTTSSSNIPTPTPAHGIAPVLYTYRVVREFYHDPSAFTQGLLYANVDAGNKKSGGRGLLYESTGMIGRTSVRVIDPDTGEVIKMKLVDDEAMHRSRMNLQQKPFGEGLALVKSRGANNNNNESDDDDDDDDDDVTLLQLTWKSNIGFIYDARTLEVKEGFTTELKDGWGLTGGLTRSDLVLNTTTSTFNSNNNNNDNNKSCGDSEDNNTTDSVLAATDSGVNIYYLDPSTMKTIHKVEVTDNAKEVPWLNELELIKGYIWANVFTTDCIAIVEPSTGIIRGWVDMKGLQSRLDLKKQV